MLVDDDYPFKHLRNVKVNPKDYSLEMKVWFGNQLLLKKSTIAELTKKYGLKESTARKYLSKARMGVLPQISYGRPMRIANDQIDNQWEEYQ